MRFGDVLRQRRIKAGLKQSDIATAMGVKRQTYTAYENNIRFPNIFKFREIATILSTTMDSIMSEVNEF